MTLRSLDQINARRIDDAGVILRVLAAVGLKLPEIGVGGVLTAEAQVAALSAAGDGFCERRSMMLSIRLNCRTAIGLRSRFRCIDTNCSAGRPPETRGQSQSPSS